MARHVFYVLFNLIFNFLKSSSSLYIIGLLIRSLCCSESCSSSSRLLIAIYCVLLYIITREVIFRCASKNGSPR